MHFFRKKPTMDEPVPQPETQQLAPFEFEPLPSETVIDQKKLFEIKDPRVIAELGVVASGLTALLERTSLEVTAAPNLAANEGLYRVTLPSGAHLMEAADGLGYRGMFKDANNHFAGHAHLNQVDPADFGSKAMAPMPPVTPELIMTATVLVVEMYYFEQIEDQLAEISEQLADIKSFQEDEYQGKVLALMVQTRKLAKFQLEVSENENLRKLRLQEIGALKETTIELLGQAISAMERILSQPIQHFSDYEKKINLVEQWHVYQNNLLKVLYRLEDIEFSLNLGQQSREECYSLSQAYEQRIRRATIMLKDWHLENCDDFGIDIDSHQRKRDGVVGLLAKPLAKVNEELIYEKVPVKVYQMIDHQVADVVNQHLTSEENRYQQGMELLVDQGKLYYVK